jgi:hypothetical protein
MWPVTTTLVRLHYGRYHDALLGGTRYHMDTSQQHPKYAFVNGVNDFEIIDTVDVSNNVGMDPNLKPSCVDQYWRGRTRTVPGLLGPGPAYAETIRISWASSTPGRPTRRCSCEIRAGQRAGYR